MRQTSLSPCYACLCQGDNPAAPGNTSAPSASTWGLKSYILWNHGEQNQQKIPQIPHPLFTTPCSPVLSKPHVLQESIAHPSELCEGCLSEGTSYPMDTHSISLSQTHPDCLFSPFRRFPRLHAPLLLSKGRSLTSWVFQL